MDRQGHLQKDIVLGEGDMYHPGGIDFDGTNVWVPVAQYRPDRSAIIYRVDAATLAVHKQFDVNDHIGGIVMDKPTGHLVGNTWGSRRFAEWDLPGQAARRPGTTPTTSSTTRTASTSRQPRCSAAASPTCRRPRPPAAPARRTSSAAWP